MADNTKIERQYVKAGQKLDSFEAISPYFDDLLARPIDDPASLEKWLLDQSELSACVSEERTARYTSMTCHTDDEKLRDRYLDYVENIEPKCRPQWHKLNVKLIESAGAKALDAERYGVLLRSSRAAVELFREENVPLQTEEARQAQQYQQICGEMMVEFEGREQTLQQMAVYGENPDREVRKSAWELVAKRRLQDREKMEDIFDKMLELRGQMAKNAGQSDYRAFAFKAYQRFDYTPDDCLAFHNAIEKEVVPVAKRLAERRQEKMGLERLRPWDLAVDEDGRDALRPFEKVEDLAAGCHTIFNRLDPELAAQFDEMRNTGLLDLESRKGKAPGGYQATFEERRRPFIFMNAVGLQRDVETLLHEGGHAFHTFAVENEVLIEYRSAPIEFCEVASMSMELLGMDHLGVFYEGDGLARAKRKMIEGTIKVFPWIATIDAFQHWLYTHPGHSRDERKQAWLEIYRRFEVGIDYAGYEDVEAYLWQRQLHLFEVPFYYIEYAIAQLGALQVWDNGRDDRPAALAKYRAALGLGGSRPLPELFKAAGARFDFTSETLGPLIRKLEAELEG